MSANPLLTTTMFWGKLVAGFRCYVQKPDCGTNRRKAAGALASRQGKRLVFVGEKLARKVVECLSAAGDEIDQNYSFGFFFSSHGCYHKQKIYKPPECLTTALRTAKALREESPMSSSERFNRITRLLRSNKSRASYIKAKLGVCGHSSPGLCAFPCGIYNYTF
jgi:hypothetical protein